MVTTAPNAEMRVSRMLSCLSFDHRLFKMNRKTVIRGKVLDTLVPLFPRYIFIRAFHQWEFVRSLSGVADFVRWGKEIITINSQEVEKLEEVSDKNHVIPGIEALHAKFKYGDSVRVSDMTSMVFGVEGVYQHSLGNDRAYVLLPWFNGQLVGTVVDERLLEVKEAKSHRTRHRGHTRSRRKRCRNGSVQLLRPVHSVAQ